MTFTERIWSYVIDEDILIEEARKLMAEGKDFNLREYNLNSPMQAAVRMRFPKLLQFLTDNMDQVDALALFDAIRFGYMQEFNILLDANLDLGIHEEFNCSALHMAASHGTIEMFDLILKKGVGTDIESNSSDDISMLRVAGTLEVVKRLVELGADIEERDDCGISILSAHSDSSSEIVSYLLDKGAEINTRDDWKQTPLLKAVQANNVETARILVSRGADKSLTDMDGTMPLDLAKEMNNEELIELLS